MANNKKFKSDIAFDSMLKSAGPELNIAEADATSTAGLLYPQSDKDSSFWVDAFKFVTDMGVDTGELDWRKLPIYLVGLGLFGRGRGAGKKVLKKVNSKKFIKEAYKVESKRAQKWSEWKNASMEKKREMIIKGRFTQEDADELEYYKTQIERLFFHEKPPALDPKAIKMYKEALKNKHGTRAIKDDDIL